MRYLLSILLFLPNVTFACIGSLNSYWYEDLLNFLFTVAVLLLPLAIVFYVTLRLIPKHKIKSASWALKKTVIFSVIVGIPIAWVLFQLVANSLCL
jgi:hypothetical protein